MKITCASRQLDVPDPMLSELSKITGVSHLTPEWHARLLDVFLAGAAACLAEIENSRGARLERALLEASCE